MIDLSGYAFPMGDKTKRPFAHQVTTVQELLSNRRFYNLSDLGTGKTLCTLWALDVLFSYGRIKKALIVCPLSTVDSVWANEIRTNLPHLRYTIPQGSKARRIELIKRDVQIVILNVDAIASYERILVEESFGVIAIDELTAFKNPTSLRSKAMRRVIDSLGKSLSQKIGVWGMTANPIPNCPTEAYGQARIVNPHVEGMPRYAADFRDMVLTQVAPFKWAVKPGANDLVRQLLQPSIRFKRDDCIDIPSCQYSTIHVEPTKEQLYTYEKFRKELSIELNGGDVTAVNAAVKVLKLLQIGAGAILDVEGVAHQLDASTREAEIWNTFESIGKDKLVIFSSFRASIARLVEYLRGMGASVESIHGDTSQNDRAKFIDRFQNNDLQILVLHPRTCAHGLTLTAACTIVWHSLPASGELYIQANGRVTRAGQKRKQHIIHLTGFPVEERVLKMLQDKSTRSGDFLNLIEEII